MECSGIRQFFISRSTCDGNIFVIVKLSDAQPFQSVHYSNGYVNPYPWRQRWIFSLVQDSKEYTRLKNNLSLK